MMVYKDVYCMKVWYSTLAMYVMMLNEITVDIAFACISAYIMKL